MVYIPPFFQQYGLPPDADERSVKRAYAKQLKKIDQEIDLPGFQALREAYEEAQEWIRYRDSGRLSQAYAAAQQAAEASSEDKTPAPQQEVVAESAMPSAGQAAAEDMAAFEAIRWPEPVRPLAPPKQAPDIDAGKSASAPDATASASASEAATQTLPDNDGQLAASKAERVFAEMLMAMRKCADEEGYAEKHLQLAMNDPRLGSSDARYAFETLVAAHLSRGWRHGNGELFNAAFDIFNWARDRRRLLSLGRPGHVLERACKEMQAFLERPARVHKAQWELLKKLRQEKNPGNSYLEANFKKLLVLDELYPVWIWMVTSKDNFLIWKAQYDALQEIARAKALKEAAEIEARNKVEPGSGGTFSVPGEDDGTAGKTGFFTALRARHWPFGRYYLPAFLCVVVLVIVQLIVHDAKTVIPPEAVVQQPVPKTTAARFDAAIRELSRVSNKEEKLQKPLYELVQLSEEGYAKASYQLGWFYREGRQSGPDETKALNWYIKAAEQGHLEAAVLVADYYFEGRGVNKDLGAAIRWYSKAAASGQSLAQIKLAHLYADGTGVKKDKQRALELIASAAEKGQPLAQSELGMIRMSGLYGTQVSTEKAAYWFMLSARQNDVLGQRMYGLIHEKGLGGYNKDLNAAANWYGRAARQGDAEARKKLKSLCQSGTYPDCSDT
ncbi:tetratricopeptide repeat protein [Undibacterium pigrum]|uniref:TPR repeat protein n=1 Tax=Undibacterium pigrum TaxID=401470 RepID=A0A318IU00_9BURK|nr:tetratricopeptide repeat protein [Undibacterium pigrum]PXX37881.1 TPR repeat protein [Undibacterium pigrum]